VVSAIFSGCRRLEVANSERTDANGIAGSGIGSPKIAIVWSPQRRSALSCRGSPEDGNFTAIPVSITPQYIHGADHEMNRRAGTENVIEIVGLGKACELISQNLNDYKDHMRRMRDRLEKQLTDYFPDAKINGHPDLRLPNTCFFQHNERPNCQIQTLREKGAYPLLQ